MKHTNTNKQLKIKVVFLKKQSNNVTNYNLPLINGKYHYENIINFEGKTIGTKLIIDNGHIITPEQRIYFAKGTPPL
ncbi:MAG: hypothetical protein PHS93_09705, partial [Candidatus Omnitrophica bacterium]|nr:hypothetical protein [Candidatus Omnitrophota bacterium]